MSDNGANKSGPFQVAHCLRPDPSHAGMLSESFLRLPDNLRFESSRRCLSPRPSLALPEIRRNPCSQLPNTGLRPDYDSSLSGHNPNGKLLAGLNLAAPQRLCRRTILPDRFCPNYQRNVDFVRYPILESHACINNRWRSHAKFVK